MDSQARIKQQSRKGYHSHRRDLLVKQHHQTKLKRQTKKLIKASSKRQL